MTDKKAIDWDKVVKQPLVVHENANVLRVMEQLRISPIQLGVVVDEHGFLRGRGDANGYSGGHRRGIPG